MARLPRLFIPRQPQHVILRGNNRQAIFADDEDRRTFHDRLREAARAHGLAIHAYALMPNHLHLLATPADERSLPATLQSVGRHYVLYFNRRHQRTGTLWEGRYRATVIEAERYLLLCSRYIELNPVRTGLTDAPGNFLWSSYNHHVGVTVDSLVTDHALYWALGNTPFERQRSYAEAFAQPISAADLDALRTATQKGWLLGSPEYQARMTLAANRRISPLTRGRPRRTPASSS
ncbi:transposase [Pandoraea terrae]|uniref:Transposase n=1 Tax=Pandoraea terrae TaxID=1537710 RepID=A0A5E4YYV2_9BURK|nr:transposase [Pandoraea terrae]VVE53495.1 transposase [Pandoraea terrae]